MTYATLVPLQLLVTAVNIVIGLWPRKGKEAINEFGKNVQQTRFVWAVSGYICWTLGWRSWWWRRRKGRSIGSLFCGTAIASNFRADPARVGCDSCEDIWKSITGTPSKRERSDSNLQSRTGCSIQQRAATIACCFGNVLAYVSDIYLSTSSLCGLTCTNSTG